MGVLGDPIAPGIDFQPPLDAIDHIGFRVGDPLMR